MTWAEAVVDWFVFPQLGLAVTLSALELVGVPLVPFPLILCLYVTGFSVGGYITIILYPHELEPKKPMPYGCALVGIHRK